MNAKWNNTKRTGGYGHSYAEKMKCEFCEEYRLCIERFDVTACINCQDELMPDSGFLSI